MTLQEKVNELNNKVGKLDTIECIKMMTEEGKTIFTTSFGYEDQVISDILFRNELSVEVVTLDTGRLFKETYSVFYQTIEKYRKPIKVFFPDTEATEKLMTEKGPFSFYESTANRHECCNIRKVEPLNRALEGAAFWITGIRADQSTNRQNIQFFEADEKRGIIKYNPLLKWNLEEVKKYINDNKVPYNVLHDKGFVSIGCEPCTRAIEPGEDFRAGRWWWEENSKKECGLHTKE